MAHKGITWAPAAVSDFTRICEFISLDSEYYAALFAKRVFALIQSIPDFPLSGRIVPEFEDPSLRERIYRNYRIVYRIKNNSIEIVSIVNSSKPLSDL